jgi:DNA-binding NarL/FixJ family response regulator
MMAQRPAALVLLDADLPGDQAHVALMQIKIRWPQTPCIVLVNNGNRHHLIDQNGADAVLVKGFSTATLAETVAELLSPTRV